MLAPDQAVFEIEHLEGPLPRIVDPQDDDPDSAGRLVRRLPTDARAGPGVGGPDSSSPCRCHTTSSCKKVLYASQSLSFSAWKKRASVSTAFTGASSKPRSREPPQGQFHRRPL